MKKDITVPIKGSMVTLTWSEGLTLYRKLLDALNGRKETQKGLKSIHRITRPKL